MQTEDETNSKDSKISKEKHRARDNIQPELIAKWESVQEDMRTQIVTSDLDTIPWQGQSDLKDLNLVAGLDISYPLEAAETGYSDGYAYAAIVIFSYPSLSIVYQDVERIDFDVPYVPGFLAFRESVPLIKLVQKAISKNTELKPDVLLVDGNGILHPQQCGSACHIGFHTGIPTIGVAKNLFHVEGIECTKKMVQDMLQVGDFVYLRKSDKILGMALKTATEAKNPVYVSVGHKISLDSARRVVLAVSKYRVPEPIRFADNLSRELIRKTEGSMSKSEENKS